jgi:acyl carrier protein
MTTDNRALIRRFIVNLLNEKGDSSGFSDDELLITGGRLDSVAAMDVVLFLEREFAADFSRTHFDLQMIDSVDNVLKLVGVII